MNAKKLLGRFLALCLCLAALPAAQGCGGNDAPDGTVTDETTETETIDMEDLKKKYEPLFTAADDGDFCNLENAPAIFYRGNTVALGGDIVTVCGEYLDGLTAITVDGEATDIIQPDRQSFKFVLPGDGGEPAVRRCVLEWGSDCRKTLYINAPKVTWVQGDEGANASPGGTLRIVGECLALAGNGAARLTGADGGSIYLAPLKIYDNYSVEFALPADMSEGEYTLAYSNGGAASDDVSVNIASSPRSEWATDVFNILDYGAVAGSKTADCSQALTDALAAAGENGGGTVYFPRGQYRMTRGTFSIPQNVTLAGESRETVTLWWGDELAENMPEYIFFGRKNFAVRDLTLVGGVMPTMFYIGQWKNNTVGENVYFENCRFIGNVRSGHGGLEALTANIGKTGALFDVRCRNLQIENCSFAWPTFLFRQEGKTAYVENMLMRGCDTAGEAVADGWTSIVAYRSIIEDNSFAGSGVGFYCDGLYFARNSISDIFTGDREAMTTDFGTGIGWCGNIEFADETTAVFPEEAGLSELTPDEERRFWSPTAVLILDGTGRGQYALMTSHEGNTVTLDRPMPIRDETSRFTLSTLGGLNWYMVDNINKNTGDFQFYTGQINSVVDGLETANAGGVSVWGGNVYDGFAEQWYISVVNCRLLDGGFYGIRGYTDDSLMHSRIRLRAVSAQTLVVGALIRRNSLSQLSNIEIWTDCGESTNIEGGDCLVIEDNHVSDTAVGISFVCGSPMRRTVLSGNTFTNVDEEIKMPIYNTDDLLVIEP